MRNVFCKVQPWTMSKPEPSEEYTSNSSDRKCASVAKHGTNRRQRLRFASEPFLQLKGTHSTSWPYYFVCTDWKFTEQYRNWTTQEPTCSLVWRISGPRETWQTAVISWETSSDSKRKKWPHSGRAASPLHCPVWLSFSGCLFYVHCVHIATQPEGPEPYGNVLWRRQRTLQKGVWN